MIVRKLKTEELRLLTQLHDYRDVDDMMAKNAEAIQNGKADIFCAFEGGLLLGELRVKYEHEDADFAQRGRRAYLYAFRVRKNHQGQGTGTQLLERVLEELSAVGYTEFTVGVEDDNPRARHMYERHGFTAVIARKQESYQGDWYAYDLLLKQTNISAKTPGKKLLALCLVLALVMSFAGCSQEKGQYFFTAEVIEVHEESLLLEVCGTGNSNLSEGAKVEVSTAVVSADGCPAFVPKEYARILLARNTDDNPPGRLEALAIYKTDETGMVTAD